jgi:hypothetical protein
MISIYIHYTVAVYAVQTAFYTVPQCCALVHYYSAPTSVVTVPELLR